MGSGLLSGLGKGMSQVGQFWLTETMSRQKEERMAAIEEKRYARDRGAKMADYDMLKGDRKAEVAASNEFTLDREKVRSKAALDAAALADKNANTRLGTQMGVATKKHEDTFGLAEREYDDNKYTVSPAEQKAAEAILKNIDSTPEQKSAATEISVLGLQQKIERIDERRLREEWDADTLSAANALAFENKYGRLPRWMKRPK